MVTLTIDGHAVTVPEDTTILEAARSIHIEIPTLCYLKGINEIGACRICTVEVEGQPRLVPACDNVVSRGMVVHTNSPRVREARRVNLRLLLSQHDTKCTKCTRSGNCKLQQLTNDYNLLGEHYIEDLRNIPDDFSNPVIRLENRCVKCMRCIQICDKVQTMGIWDLMGTGSHTTVGVARTRTLGESDCTFCGQCVTHCPTGALTALEVPVGGRGAVFAALQPVRIHRQAHGTARLAPFETGLDEDPVQAFLLGLLLDLLGRVVGRLGASRPAGEHRRAGEGAHHQCGRQSQQQELFPAPALARGFGGHEKRHHALLIVSGKVNGVHGTPQFRFYIVGHTTWLLSSVSSVRSFRRPRDRYWVMLASDLPITWAISLAEYSS